LFPGWSIQAHFSVDVIARSGEDPHVESVVRLIDALAGEFRPHFGAVHTLSQAEVSAGGHRPDLVTEPVTILNTSFGHLLRQGIPSVYWRMYLGAPYVDLFGEHRLLSAPVWGAVPHRWGAVLQVTRDPPTNETWASFERDAAALREFLGRAAFWPGAERIPTEVATYGT
jgi:hypothetical protein